MATNSKNQRPDVYKKILQPFVPESLLTSGFATSSQPGYQLFNFFTLLLDHIHKAKMWFSSCCSLGTVQAGELFRLAKCLKRHHSNQSSLHFHMECTSHEAVTPANVKTSVLIKAILHISFRKHRYVTTLLPSDDFLWIVQMTTQMHLCQLPT